VVTDTPPTIKVLLEAVSSMRSVSRSYKEVNSDNRRSSVRESVKKKGIWKGAAIQRGFEPESRGIAIVISRYQATTSEVIEG
jgi:hypothetical protein